MNIINYILIAVALSMDTFSLSLSLIMRRKKIYLYFILLVSFMHFIFPIIGSIIGNMILNNMLISSNKLLGIIFILLFLKLYFDIKKGNNKPININLGIIFAMSIAVRMDSFITGIGLTRELQISFLPSLIFFITSGIFTLLGLYVGNFAKTNLGKITNNIGLFLLLLLAIIHICK